SAPHAMAPSGGATIAPGGGGAIAPGAGAPHAVAPRGAAIAPGGGQTFARTGPAWQGRTWHGRRHFRGGPGFGFVVPSPYYDDYAYDYTTPYAYEDDDSCYRVRYIRGHYRRVWVCQ